MIGQILSSLTGLATSWQNSGVADAVLTYGTLSALVGVYSGFAGVAAKK